MPYWSLLWLLVFLGGLAGPAVGGTVPYRIFDKPIMEKKVETLRERRLRQVVHQSVDFSCGAATVATILRYYYGVPVTEREAILGMFSVGESQRDPATGLFLAGYEKIYRETPL